MSPTPQLPSLRTDGRARLLRLCASLAQPVLAERCRQVADVLLGPGGEGGRAVVNLGMRFEPSGPAVTVLVDPGAGQSTERAWQVGLELSHRATRELGVDPWPLREVQHLFVPAPSIPTAFALRYQASIRSNGDVGVAAVLNPNVMGREGAPQLIARACQLLGARPDLTSLNSHELRAEYLAIELAPPPIARIEVGSVEDWFLHQRADRPFTGATPFSAGQVADWLAMLAAFGARGRITVRTRLSAHRDGHARAACLLLPLGRYARSDASALERVAGYLEPADAVRLERCVGAMTARPLETSRGAFEWVGFSADDPAHSLVQIDLGAQPLT